MHSVILGHPYSGALYAYVADEMQGPEYSHTRSANSYYRTLYGRGFAEYIELSLTFLLLYDQVWLAPADNPMPPRAEESGYNVIPQLGVYFVNEELPEAHRAFDERQRHIARYLEDRRLQYLLSDVLKLPRSSWHQILDSTIQEASLSAHKRLALLCSRGRRAVIQRLIAIDKPSLHPLFPDPHTVNFVESYRSFTAMALRPHGLDDLMEVKFDRAVRAYGSGFLDVALKDARDATSMDVERLKQLIREAMDTQVLSRRFAGRLEWAARIFHLAHLAHLVPEISGAAVFAGHVAAEAGAHLLKKSSERAAWYEFRGAIDKAVGHAQLLRELEDASA